jgi:phospholipid-translocating ATPase
MKSKPSEYGDEKQNLIRYFESRVQRWYKVYFLELILRQKPLPPSKHGRRISLRPVHEEPLIDERTGRGYVSNTIRSSRYTIFDFLPKQFIFQATRLSNFYFICIGIPQAIPGLSTTGSYTTILPLLFFILLTIAKEGYDDFRRHRLDKVENRQLALVLKQSVPTSSTNVACTDSSSRSFSWSYKWPLKHVEEYSSVEVDDSGLRWAKVSWQDIKVGDIIRLRRDDAIPADVVLLYSSGENGIAYVETMAIDGETNLKIRQAPEALKTCASIDGLQSCPATFVMEDPNSDLYSFIGKVAINEEADISLSLNEIILRGSIVRNTEFVIGMAINTGEECKIRMNANHHPKAKKPRLEKFANQIVLTLVFYVIVLTAGCSAGYVLWQRSTGRNSFYLDDSPVDMKEIIIGFAIEFNNVIPLALYVSLEIVKIVQMFLISNDIEMYDEASNTPMVCNTNTILENLGQVTHILSDKTGTLTENVMEFRRMSISGYSWTDKEETGAYPGSYSAMDLMKYVNAHPSHWLSKRTREFVLGMALCNTCLPERNEGEKIKFQASSPDEVALVQAAQDLGYQLVNRSSRYITLEINLSNENSVQEVYEVLDVIEFSSYRKRMSIILRNRDGRIWLLCKGADSVIIPRLQSSTLAEEAREVIRESFEVERQQLRSEHTLERSSIGGRMSLNAARPSLSVGRVSLSGEIGHVASTIVSNGHGGDGQRSLKHPDELISIPVLAENSVFGDIKSIPMLGDTQTFTNCFKHLHEFATEGLRTLLFAQRYIPEDEYLTWKQIYNKASTVLIDRQEQIETAAELIEQSLELLGASAIEDKLQTGVNETVEKLQRANISIWMLTGDKRETAMNIAHSAGIFKPHSDLYVLDSTKGNLEDQLQKWRDDLKPNGGHSLAVIDGDTLAHIEVNLSLKAAFYSLIPSFNSVVCCRASPAQKANIVMAIKSRVPGALTLAIGDGANDIAMIQASVSSIKKNVVNLNLT